MKTRLKTGCRWCGAALAVLAVMSGAPVLAQDLDPQTLLKKMSDQIASLDAFVVVGDAYADARLPEGHIIEHTSEVTLKILRPNGLRLTNRSSEDSKEIYINEGVITVSTQPRNFYAQTEIPIGIEAGVEFALEELDIDAPLLDLLARDVGENLSKDASGLRYLGTSLVRGEIYHHIAIRSPEIDLQIWIASEGPPLPGKIVMTSKWEGGSPRFTAFLDWDTDPKIPTGSLEFEPAADAVQIQFVRDIESR
jgi:hypothetical protein